MALYCSGCGGVLPGGARFCSACGKPVVEPGFASATRPPLMRPLAGRKIAGVCLGLANQYGWDVTWTRVIAVLLAIGVFPIGLIAYFVFWVIMPQEPQSAPAITNLNTTT